MIAADYCDIKNVHEIEECRNALEYLCDTNLLQIFIYTQFYIYFTRDTTYY